MTKQDKPELAKILSMLSAVPGWVPVTLVKATYDIYFGALEDLTIEQLGQAATKWLRIGKQFPNPANLREMSITDTNRLTAGEAWSEVVGEAGRVGADGNPKFSSENIKTAVKSVGWINICYTPYEDHNTLRAHFMKTYDNLSTRDERDRLLGLPDKIEARKMLGMINRGIEQHKGEI